MVENAAQYLPEQVPLGIEEDLYDDDADSAAGGDDDCNIDIDGDENAQLLGARCAIAGPVRDYLVGLRSKLAKGDASMKRAVENGQFWHEPPDPAVTVYRSMNRGNLPKPDAFYMPRVFMFVPHWTWPDVAITCPSCGNYKGVKQKGWHQHIRKIVGMDSCYFMITCRY